MSFWSWKGRRFVWDRWTWSWFWKWLLLLRLWWVFGWWRGWTCEVDVNVARWMWLSLFVEWMWLVGLLSLELNCNGSLRA